VLGHGLVYILVDWQQSFTGSPVHLADELTTEGVNDACNGGCLALADEVEIEHALDGSRLQTVDKASCLFVEESVLSTRAQRSARSCKAADVVVGREASTRSCAIRRRPICGGRRHREDCEEEGIWQSTRSQRLQLNWC
jgi:hypothetical protein